MSARYVSVYVKTFSIALMLTVACFSRTAIAVEASPFPVQVQQPDGTNIKLQVRGNEYFHWLEDLQGFTVVRQANSYVYGLRDDKGQLAPTNLMVGKVNPANAGLIKRILPETTVIRDRANQILPPSAQPPNEPAITRVSPTGNVKNVVILMKFKDHDLSGRTVPSVSDFDTIFNTVGGDPTLAPSGSVRDVYFENSYGAMTLDSTVFAWVTLPETEAFYADGDSGLTVKIRQAIKDALDLADPLVNFSLFDQDSNGFVDAIAFVHSGYGAEWGGVDADGADFKDRIWSHRWVIPTWTSGEGIKVRDYHINPGLWSTSGTAPGRIGVICHETGHFFGLPDLYDTSGAGSGIGSWGMMANSWGFDGSQHFPPHFSAWSKIKLGWNTATDISTPGAYSVQQAETAGAKIFKISAGYPSDEYLLIENRQPVGFDQKIPAGVGGKGGLAVWHIDEDKPANNDPGCPGDPGWPGNNKHYKIALLQADANCDLEKGNNRGDAGDLFRAGFVDKITPTTTPDTKGYQGGTVTNPGYEIFDITQTASTIRFRLGTGDDDGDDGDAVCCTRAASVNFSLTEKKKASNNTNLAEATITLDEEMDVHISSNTSASTAKDGLLVRTGFYHAPSPNTMWTNSYRKINFAAGRSQNLGSSMTIRLKPGKHTIFWKIWVSGAEVAFDSGCMMIEAFAIPKGASPQVAGSSAPPASELEKTIPGTPDRLKSAKDEGGNDVLQFQVGGPDRSLPN